MTFSLGALFLSASAYLLVLFVIAQASEKGWIPRALVRHPAVYVLSLGVYATTWSYYGSVGFAADSGLLYLTIYLGVTLAFALAPIVLMPLLRLTQRHQLTSIADVFAFRFDSRLAGVLVTLMLLTGSLPYIALQIRAVSESTQVLSGDSPPQVIAVVFCLLVSVFAIIFGARHVSPREKHSGLVAAIAFESLIKLFALVLLAIIAIAMAFGGWGGLHTWLEANPTRLDAFHSDVGSQAWTGLLFLSFAAAFLLPRQFHMLFAENLHPRGLRTASWGFPLYLLVLAMAIPPILWAAQALGMTTPADYSVLGIAMASDSAALALLTYLGGISAASAMIIVTTLALSSMCLNHLVLPIIRVTPHPDLYGRLRWLRRALIGGLIAAGYGFYLSLAQTEGLVAWGLISFLAMAQLLPGIIALLSWPAATRAGFIAGLMAGGTIWGFTALLPALSTVGPIHIAGLDIATAQSPAYFGQLAFWTVSTNAIVLVAVSLLTRQNPREYEAAAACREVSVRIPSGALIATSPGEFVVQLTPVMGEPAARAEIEKALNDRNLAWSENRPNRLQQLREQVQSNLSGMMGPVLARDIVDECLRLDVDSRSVIAQNMHIIEERLEQSRNGLRGIAAELDALRRYHRQMLEDLPLGVVAISTGKRIARWNPALHQITGIGASAMLGRLVSEVPAPWGELLEQFIDENTSHAYKRSLPLPQGVRWLNLHKTLISETPGGSNNDYLVLIEDVTDGQRLEDELAHSERLASIGRLAAGVAHEIGNPITAIACLAQELAQDNNQQTSAQSILEQTQRISHIVQTLTSYAHAGHDATPQRPDDIPLLPIALEAGRLVQLDPEANQIEFTYDIAKDMQVLAAHQSLVQVFVNLYNNAVHASADGGRIHTSAKRQRNHVQIRITDSGHGIPSSIRSKIMEPFFTTKRPGEGTGLGLALVDNILSHYHGSVRLQSRRGRGTGAEAIIQLPRATAKPPEVLDA